MRQQNRLSYLDVAKGIAILLVVQGHTVMGWYSIDWREGSDLLSKMTQFIYSFHMPLFIMLSGISFSLVCASNDRLMADRKLNRQCVNLVLLYLLHSVIWWCSKRMFSNDVNIPVTIRDLYMIPLKSFQHFWLWYLYVLTGLYLIMKYIAKVKRKSLVLMLGVMASILGAYITDMDIVNEEYLVFRVPFYFLFFYLGFIFYPEKLDKLKKYPLIYVGEGVIFIVLYVSKYKIPEGCQEINCLLKVILGVTASLAVIGMAQMINSSKILEYLGKHTLEIYLLHPYILVAGRLVFRRLHVDMNVFTVTVLLILGIIIPLAVSVILRKIPIVWKFLFRPVSLIAEKKEPMR